LPPIYGLIKPFIWILLIIIVICMFIRLNKNFKTFLWSCIIFILSGIMGYTLLNLPISANVSLLSIFTGLFGVSTLLYSLSQRSILPIQNKFYSFKINSNVLKGILAGSIAGTVLGFLPGLGPAQGGVIAQELTGGGDFESNNEGFLVAISGINTSDTLFSLIMIYLIGNPRSGIAVYVNNIMQEINFNYLVFFIFSTLTAVSISLFLCIKIGDKVSECIEKVNYEKLLYVIITLMSVLMVVFSLWYHANILYMILVYITAISLGLLPHYVGINKSNLMGVLIVPAIIIYHNIF